MIASNTPFQVGTKPSIVHSNIPTQAQQMLGINTLITNMDLQNPLVRAWSSAVEPTAPLRFTGNRHLSSLSTRQGLPPLPPSAGTAGCHERRGYKVSISAPRTRSRRPRLRRRRAPQCPKSTSVSCAPLSRHKAFGSPRLSRGPRCWVRANGHSAAHDLATSLAFRSWLNDPAGQATRAMRQLEPPCRDRKRP